jgi:hypothetical protein
MPRKPTRTKESVDAAQPEASAPATKAADPGKEKQAMSPALRQGMFNAALAVTAVAIAAVIQQVFAPSLVSLALLAVIAAAAGTAFGIYKWLYGDLLKALVQRYVEPARARAVILVVLGLEVVAIVALIQLPPPHIIRLVPGPRLDEELGFDGQKLTVEFDRKRFTCTNPPQKPVYAGAWTFVVRSAVDREPPAKREATLNSVLAGIYVVTDKQKIDDWRTGWLAGDTVVMERDGAGRMTDVTAAFDDGTGEKKLTVRPAKSYDGIETYVAELP